MMVMVVRKMMTVVIDGFVLMVAKVKVSHAVTITRLEL